MASGTWNTGFWGQNQWNDLADPTFTVTGIAATATLGTTTEVTGEINNGWGRLEWGINGWNIAGTFIPTGVAATATLGTNTIVNIDVTPAIGTQLITGTLASVAVDIQSKVFPSGIALTSNLGTADAGPDAMATGIQASAALGTIDAFNQTGWGRQGWNVNAWGVEGQFATALVSGQAMTAAVSAPQSVTGTGLVNLNTLNVAQATLGNVDPAPDTMITGNFMVASLGSAAGVVDYTDIPTGIPLTAALNSVSVDLNTPVDVTGQFQRARLSSAFNIVIHVDVGVTGFGLTMTQGSGSALIWNEVDTGSAPISPPGWTEVAA